MNSGRMLFSQVLGHLPLHEFRRCVRRYGGDRRVRSFTCLDQFLCMAFAQLTYRESLRDIVTCLRALDTRLYHMGIRGAVSRSTLADANEKRDWRIYADLAQTLITRARALYLDDDLGLELQSTVYAFDSTTIDVCMTLFPWAGYKQAQHAIKLHTLMDLRGNIPTFIRISPAKTHDVNMLDQLVPEPGAFYLFDRGYLDFTRLHRWTQHGAFFVTRARKNLRFKGIESRQVDKTAGVQADQIISLMSFYSLKGYADRLRRVRFFDAERGKCLVFLTNNFTLPSLTIAELYRRRWQIELFFKWIKHHLRIKAFYGTSANAVKTQVWIAVCVYLLVAIVRKQVSPGQSLHTILQILSVSILEKTPINRAFSPIDHQNAEGLDHNQLVLFDF